ncbi:rhoptry protein ROP4 [Besnoitia besnoiti]|uniref:Rhoptry protein ROP4 n=1 Tax=Besnoitia besnoiti TaxID=94643 RepID=A0A2A9M8U1_BESBE|nr:rhoptry protein ROP4 [Besnoitia besnoiti]PFH32741.1 rhoptry protein ROP4 [Besnoitia besnoiti]
MERTSFARILACLAQLAVVFVAMVFCRARTGGSSMQQQRRLLELPRKTDVNIAVVQERNGPHGWDSIAPATSVTLSKREEPGGGSWIEEDAQGDSQPSGVSQPATFLRRVQDCFGGCARIWGTSAAPRDERTQSRVRYGSRLLPHWRRGTRLITHSVAAAGAYLSTLRRQPSPPTFAAFNINRGGGASPTLHNALYFRYREPGDRILEYLLSKLPQEEPVHLPPHAADLDKAVSKAFWPEGDVVRVESVLRNAQRRLRRNLVTGCGSSGIVFPATDLDTHEDIAVKIVRYHHQPSLEELKLVTMEARCTNLFEKVKSPDQAYELLRFLVPSDVVKFPERGLTVAVSSDGLTTWLVNLFMLMPRAHLKLTTVVKALASGSVPTGLAYHARLQLSSHVVRLAANLQDQGVVHGDVALYNFLLMRDGRMLLADFGIAYAAREERASIPKDSASHQRVTPRESVQADFSKDALGAGLVIYQIWCGYAEGQQPDFSECSGVPDSVKSLIQKFVDPSPTHRVLAMQALHTPEYLQIKSEIAHALPLYEDTAGTSDAAEMSSATGASGV